VHALLAQRSQQLIQDITVLTLLEQMMQGTFNETSPSTRNPLSGAAPAATASIRAPIPNAQNIAAIAKNVPSGNGASVNASVASPAGFSKNSGGVPQTNAVSGVAPGSSQTVNAGTGDDETYNVSNDTNRAESFTYSVQGVNKATITVAPGQTKTITAGSGDIGVRISPSDMNGAQHTDEVLFENGGAANGQRAGAENIDISMVDGSKDFAGNAVNMTATLSDRKTAGDDDTIRPYRYSADDAAAMGLVSDPSKTVSIVISNG